MTGHVTLVGGGPGRPELLTVAAVRALGAADVVLYDRLAPHEVLDEYAPGALRIDVGKRPGHHAIPQHEIEGLLVEHALAGSRVVRLKGGDPYVLGRGSEEVLACHRAGVPVEVIPGITSAVSVPGAAGIPLTHRGLSHLFTVVSGHAPLTESELAHLAGLGGTIVVLMGVSALPALTAGLARHGMRADMPVAIVERGTRAEQRTTVGELSDIVYAAGRTGVSSPAVIVVGEVVRLAYDGEASAAELMQRAHAIAAVAP